MAKVASHVAALLAPFASLDPNTKFASRCNLPYVLHILSMNAWVSGAQVAQAPRTAKPWASGWRCWQWQICWPVVPGLLAMSTCLAQKILIPFYRPPISLTLGGAGASRAFSCLSKHTAPGLGVHAARVPHCQPPHRGRVGRSTKPATVEFREAVNVLLQPLLLPATAAGPQACFKPPAPSQHPPADKRLCL